MEKENDKEQEKDDYNNIIKYLSSKIKYKYSNKDYNFSLEIKGRKIYDICESSSLKSIDQLITYINDYEEKGALDYLINTMNKNPEFLDKSFFYLYELTTMLTYKKYISPIKKYIIDKYNLYVKFSVLISLFLNSYPKEQNNINEIKVKIEQIKSSSYTNIRESMSVLSQKLKNEDFIFDDEKNKNESKVNYNSKCLEFYENLKKLCLLLFNYPLTLDKANENKKSKNKKMTRKTAFKEFITLINEEMDYMRSEEYKKFKKEEEMNLKKELNNEFSKKSKFNKGYLLPFNNDVSNSDEHSLIIVNILPDYSSIFNTKESAPIKLTCECIELGEAENENFFELYDNNNFYEKHNEYAYSKEDNFSRSGIYKSI